MRECAGMSLVLRVPNQGGASAALWPDRRVSGLGCAAEGSLAGDIRSDPNQTLAKILAAVQPRDRTRSLLESIEDVLSIADLSVAHPVLEFPQCLGMALDMVKDQKALSSFAAPTKAGLPPCETVGIRPRAAGAPPALHVTDIPVIVARLSATRACTP